ncbi:TOMM precursor leader peptide-binding protein [Streptomyces sp. SP18CS02]|uniref:TOMM precursor leader peptide-binding protein n=1 Tax=Streptomyces sp. SP18CS02 TaxID=3002531 RepID=UPI002E77D163|nr:TOMM precursor leader peptide-binding protein [Streptomyces sp. SP18CS02]MEE1757350.1 TOMM precursor leader peptide-binding protein [Streptomyces sp. SP18CS02]
MHPKVKPALRRAWRDLQFVQFGVTPAHAVVLGPLDTATGSLLDLFDGTRGLDLLREEARALGLPEGRLEALLSRMEAAGLMDDAAAGDPAVEVLRNEAGALDRLRADVASLSVVHGEPGGALRRVAARRGMRVQVRGAGRVGAGIAALLSASGVGRVEVLDSGRVEPWDVTPCGPPAAAVGERRDTAARRLVARSAPGGRPPRTVPGRAVAGSEPGLSLIVVAPRDGLAAYAPDPMPAEDWVATGTPHLYAGVAEATGVVGPLVLPGGTACARCLDMGRADRDPAWPRMVAQWRSGRRGAVPPCDPGLATMVAGLAAAHALSFLDGGLPTSTGARWEAALPLLDWHTQRVTAHPGCPCGAAGRGEGEHPSAGGTGQDTMAGKPPPKDSRRRQTRHGSLGFGGAHV